MLKIILRLTLLALFPGLLIYYGTSKLGINLSSDLQKEAQYKLFAFIVGSVISVLIVPALKENQANKLKRLSGTIRNLLGVLRQSLSHDLQKVLTFADPNEKDLKMNIRIFVPYKKKFAWLIWPWKKRFILKDYEGLNTRTVDNLVFQVYPNDKAQGLVGQVYCQKSVKYDFALNPNLPKPFYKLQENQVDKTNYCYFAIAAPIFKGTGKNIEAIVSFDSEVKVNQPADGQTDWIEIIRKSCKIIHTVHNSIK